MGQLIHNRKGMEVFLRELRKNPTLLESLLWKKLQANQLEGRKFRRLHSIGVYILDFYCPKERLCIEIDGNVHKSPEAIIHDRERDQTLSQLHIHTLRISNDEIETDIEAALTKIRDYFNN